MRRHDGFTLIEVMVSLGVMTIGAMALIGMEQQTTRANMQARRTTTATQIAQNWIERLKMDGLSWSTVTVPIPAPAVDLGSTVYLRTITDQNAEGAFRSFPATAAARGHSSSFDYFGDDIIANVGNPRTTHYCASYRLTWIYVGRLMRADVRVYWPREGTGATLPADCADDGTFLTPIKDAALIPYYVVYLSTAIRNLQFN